MFVVPLRLMLLLFNNTVTTELYTLSLHDALPISAVSAYWRDGQLAKSEDGMWIASDEELNEAARFCERVLADQSVSVPDRKSTRLNSSHTVISYAVFCLKKKKKKGNRACHELR